MRKQSGGENVNFEIENIIEETNNGDISFYKGTTKLNEFNRNGRSNDDRRATKRTVQQPGSTNVTKRRQVIRSRFLAK